MFSYLTSLYTQFSEATKGNPILATGVSMWGLGTLTYLCKGIPLVVYEFVKRQLVTSMTFNNASYNELNFSSFSLWYAETGWQRFSRSFTAIKQNKTGGLKLGVGFGTHFLFYKGRLIWFVKEKLPSNGSHYEKEQITVHALSRNRNVLADLVTDVSDLEQSGGLSIKSAIAGQWTDGNKLVKRDLSTVIIDRKIKETLVNDISDFYNSREWYDQRGFSYKRTYLIHGCPGSGKTSLIRALACHFSKNVYRLNLDSCTDESLANLLSEVEAGSFVLLEDFDSSAAVTKRDSSETEYRGQSEIAPVRPRLKEVGPGNVDVITKGSFQQTSRLATSVTLSGVLNAFDGIVGLDDVVVFMTTNHIERIDPAMLRTGRVDMIIKLNQLTNTEIREYINVVFPEAEIDKGVTFADITGSDLQELFMRNKKHSKNFIASIPTI